jgi:glycosyltransferase involved in cell wall biosynthesis
MFGLLELAGQTKGGNLKILHIVSGDLSGGAARGAYWLHRGLCELGVDSFLLNNNQDKFNDETVASLAITPAQKFKSMILPRLGSLPKYFYRKRKAWIFNTGFGGVDFTLHPAYQEADILHLHWINGVVSMHTLRKVKKPIVWTLRDMWPFTGGCHYAMDCDRYVTGCGQCPQLGSQNTKDLSRIIVKNKLVSLPKSMRVVGISNWLSDCASNSTVFRDFRVQTISNNIDTNEFFPVDSKTARQVLGLPMDKKIILVGAQSATSFYKGFDLLIAALNHLKRADVHILLFGHSSQSVIAMIPQPVTPFGFLSDIISMRLIYSAADVFVSPSRMEAFGKTLVESMSCGTPVVCFDATGPSDIIGHQTTGYKAMPFNPVDLAKGIDWVLSLKAVKQRYLSVQSRERAVRLFDSQVIAGQYLELYEDLLDGV